MAKVKIGLFGASGMIGQRITLEALVRGHDVKSLAHHLNGPITHPRLTEAQVDIFDPANILEASADTDIVVNATSGRKSLDTHAFYIDSTQALIEAFGRAGEKRLLVVGGAGSLEIAPGQFLKDAPDFPAAARPTANAQAETLVMYRASPITWTFFCPSRTIQPGRRSGKYRRGGDQLLTNDQGESYISAEDYAFALLDEIEQPQAVRQRFTAVSLEK
ncbi:MAG TPA: NAD(P)H-binding protein [Ktedonobacterales bacterium]|nr:NAD(P)H-binding protein [Ktedonobacterales bacterium]